MSARTKRGIGDSPGRRLGDTELQAAVNELARRLNDEEMGATMCEGREAADRGGRAIGLANALDVIRKHTGVVPVWDDAVQAN